VQVSKTPTRAGSQKSLETIYFNLKLKNFNHTIFKVQQELEAKSHLKPRLKTQEHAETSTIQVCQSYQQDLEAKTHKKTQLKTQGTCINVNHTSFKVTNRTCKPKVIKNHDLKLRNKFHKPQSGAKSNQTQTSTG
jgi:hypothetical protein